MVACFRIGVVVLPCKEQLRAKDLRLRFDVTRPSVLTATSATRPSWRPPTGLPCHCGPHTDLLGRRARWPAATPSNSTPNAACSRSRAAPTATRRLSCTHSATSLVSSPGRALARARPATSLVHGRDRLVKSARNASSRRGCVAQRRCCMTRALTRGAARRLLARERVNVLCMAPTEYRVIAKGVPSRPAPAATPRRRRRGAQPGGARAPCSGDRRCGSGRLRPDRDRADDRCTAGRADTRRFDGPAAARGATVDRHGELVRGSDDRADVLPALSRHERSADTSLAHWRPCASGRHGCFYFEGRADDVIICAGYRIGPFEVESALVAHPAVAEAAVVAAPDTERGEIVRAVVVLRDGFAVRPSAGARAAGPRQVRRPPHTSTRARSSSSHELPKTASGKIRRALLREQGALNA